MAETSHSRQEPFGLQPSAKGQQFATVAACRESSPCRQHEPDESIPEAAAQSCDQTVTAACHPRVEEHLSAVRMPAVPSQSRVARSDNTRTQIVKCLSNPHRSPGFLWSSVVSVCHCTSCLTSSVPSSQSLVQCQIPAPDTNNSTIFSPALPQPVKVTSRRKLKLTRSATIMHTSKFL